MWKKTLLALGLAGLLALPVGAALATYDGDDITSDQPLVTVEQDRDRDQVRDRIQDPAECGNCPGSENPAPVMTGDRDRDRDRTRLQDPDQTAIQEREQTRLQERDCDGEGDGARLQERVRTQTHVQNEVTHQAGANSAGSNRNGEGNRRGQDG